jgi:molybdopterin converting factor small subunit
MKRVVELYGRLREAAPEPALELELREGATAQDALEALRAALGAKAKLLEGAALATEDAVLAGKDALPKEGRLAALPPVCGG